jgi:hypothetical protein
MNGSEIARGRQTVPEDHANRCQFGGGTDLIIAPGGDTGK